MALAVYCQLEADVDDVLAAQAVKCLVHLSKEMLQADRAAGLAQAAPAANGPSATPQNLKGPPQQNDHTAPQDAEVDPAREQTDAIGSESDEEEGQQDGMTGAAGLTLQGLVRRMVKLAGDRYACKAEHSLTECVFLCQNQKILSLAPCHCMVCTPRMVRE